MSLTSKGKLYRCHAVLVLFAKESLNYVNNKRNKTDCFNIGNPQFQSFPGT